jgi:hypothetical protein
MKRWCKTHRTLVRQGDKELKERLFRCPDCKKRFMTSVSNCVGDLDFKQACCWYEYFPLHKTEVKTETPKSKMKRGRKGRV